VRVRDDPPILLKGLERMELTKGTRIYYGGDMANDEGFGEIVEEVAPDRFYSDLVKIKMDDGREMTINKCMFSKEYKGHGGTRFVTKEAYDLYRAEQIKRLEETYRQMGLVQ
jgi:hypothetical protein